MTALCACLGITCILYYAFLVMHVGIMVNFGWFWAALGIAFLLITFLHRFSDKPGVVWASRILFAAVAAGLIVIGVLSAQIISGMHPTVPSDLQYAIVLGAQVRGRTPSRALVHRMEKAVEIADQFPQLELILSGGQGDDEQISEAACMREYLIGQGLSEKRLILEDQSTTTRENLMFSDRLTGCAKKRCGIVTNDFHIFRALKTARKLGYQDVYGLAAKSEALMKPHFIVREAVALLYAKLRA